MDVLQKAVLQEDQGVVVEYVAEGGDAVQVNLRHAEGDGLSRSNAEARARRLLLHVINTDTAGLVNLAGKSMDDMASGGSETESAAVASLKAANDAGNADELQDALEATFPASDPVSAASNTIPGSGLPNEGK